MSVKFLVVVYLFTVFNNSGLLFSNRAIDTVTGFPTFAPSFLSVGCIHIGICHLKFHFKIHCTVFSK